MTGKEQSVEDSSIKDHVFRLIYDIHKHIGISNELVDHLNHEMNAFLYDVNEPMIDSLGENPKTDHTKLVDKLIDLNENMKEHVKRLEITLRRTQRQ